MPKLSQRGRAARAALATAAAQAKRQPGPETERQVDDRRRQFRYVTAEDYVRQLVDGAPPLTDDQRQRLAAILQGTAA